MTTATVQPHLDYLDGWRGLAILALLIGHFFPMPGLNLGTLGVNLFFVLSGWLMTRLLFAQQTPIDTFYRRRISRIVPAHLAFVCIASTFWAVSAQWFSAAETLAALLFLNNYIGPPPGHSIMPLGHIWSLSVEEHSYVLLSVLAVAARKGVVRAKVGVGAAAVTCAACALAYSAIYSGPKLEFDQWLHTEVAGYGIFASSFIFLTLRQSRTRLWPAFLAPLALTVGIALHWWSVPIAVRQIAGVGALALAVNLLPQARSSLKALLASRALRYAGLWSFSLYIWQQPFYLWSRGGKAPTWVGLALACFASLLSFYLIEKPARTWLNQNWGAFR